MMGKFCNTHIKERTDKELQDQLRYAISKGLSKTSIETIEKEMKRRLGKNHAKSGTSTTPEKVNSTFK